MTATEVRMQQPRATLGNPPHFAVQRAELVRELGLALGSVEKKTTIPILANVKFSAEGDCVGVSATDLEIALSGSCTAKIATPGAFTLPAKKLFDYVNLLPEGEIEIKVSPNYWATITSGRSKTRIAGMSAESFPEIPVPATTNAEPIPTDVLARLIRQTQYAISSEESRFTLNGALLEIEVGVVRLVATDGHRLALVEATMESPMHPFKALIPRKALANLSRVPGDTAKISADDNHLFFEISDYKMTARRMTGNFPDYGRIMPKQFEGNALIDRKELLSALGRTRGFSDERTSAILLAISGNALKITANVSNIGEIEESVSADIAGPSLEIGLNAKYLCDFLNAAETEQVSLAYSKPTNAVQFSPVGQAGRSLCVVMPMRI